MAVAAVMAVVVVEQSRVEWRMVVGGWVVVVENLGGSDD